MQINLSPAPTICNGRQILVRPGADFGTYNWIVNKLILNSGINCKKGCVFTQQVLSTCCLGRMQNTHLHTIPPQVFCCKNSASLSVLGSRCGEQKWSCGSGHSSASEREGFWLRFCSEQSSWVLCWVPCLCPCAGRGCGADAAGARRKRALFLEVAQPEQWGWRWQQHFCLSGGFVNRSELAKGLDFSVVFTQLWCWTFLV